MTATKNIFEGAGLSREAGVTREKADVCVIGSGCGGATLAARLAEAGRDVVIVEQGGYYTKDDFDQREINMLAKIDGGRGLDTSGDGSVVLTYGRNVGGASVHYWADSYRLPDDRAELWDSEFGLATHSAKTLAPHFAAIERDLHIVPAPDAYVNKMNALMREGATDLGWRVRRVPAARKDCKMSGYCMQGCSYDAKQSQLITHLPRALARGARLYSDTRADQFRFEARGAQRLTCSVLDRATGRPTGHKVEIEAKAFVVATGGFETPAFLLRQGLGDRLPALGKNFFCNPCPMTHAIFDDEIIQWRNVPASWGIEEFRQARYDGADQVFSRGGAGSYREGGYLLMANQLQPAMLAATLPGIGESHAKLMRQLPNLGGAISWIDDAEAGRIGLDGTKRTIDVPIDGGNGLRLRDAWKKQARVLLAAGAREVLFADPADTRVTRVDEIEAAVESIEVKPARVLFAAPHPGGAARMGADPSDSVVGFEHRVHGLDNVYVADPSVFPTPPSVDPSLTIMAFSRIAADAVHASIS
jgi:choline dehydrogenase-like flavoprotein